LVIAKCKECGKEYQLSSRDNLGEFQCECGGELEYKEKLEVKNEDSIKMKGIHWKTLILGIVVTAFLGFLLGLIGIIIATLCVGYSVDKNYKNGAVHGALAGFIGGFIAVNISNIISIILPSNTNTEFGFLMIGTLLSFIILYGFTGAISGAIGAFIKQKRG
jgi:MFS family permease